jgi:hypothetical protein
LRTSVFERLTEIRQSQSRQLQAGIADLKNSLVTYSRGSTASQALEAFTAGFDQLGAAAINPAQQQSLDDYYAKRFAKDERAQTGENVDVEGLMPTSNAQRYLQANYTDASHNGQLYKRSVLGRDDIVYLIREAHLETLTSADGEIDFWFTPSTHPSHQRINRKATEIFHATTEFGASRVPLLRGIVVLATHTSDGELAGLTDAQMDRLVDALDSTSWRADQVLSARYARAERRRRRSSRAATKSASASLTWLTQ